MNLDRTDIVLRERRFWESVDIGSVMYRRWLGPIAVFFVLPFAVVVAALLGALSHLPNWLPALAIWWLKPLWDRLVMAPAGVRLFDSDASFRAMAEALRGVFSPSLAADLSLRRFNPLRAYMIPVSMFERLPFTEAARRKRWLRRNSFGRITGLTVLFLGLEALLALSLIFGIAFLGNISLITTRSNTPIMNSATYLTFIYSLVVLIVEPLFVLSCFSVYVNRRTTTEGWDLKLAFSRLRRRFPVEGGRTALMVLVLVFALQAVGAHAQESSRTPPPGRTSAFVQRAHSVLNGSEFGKTVMQRKIAFTFQHGATMHTSRAANVLDLLLAAEILRFFMLSIAGALVVFVVVRNWHRIIALGRSLLKPRKSRAETLERRELETQAADWIDVGRRAWAGGRFREAIGTLYRGSLLLAKSRYGIEVSNSATESECLRIVRNARPTPAFLAIFADLTRTWVRLAWAGNVPEGADFDRICSGLVKLGEGNESQ